MPPKGVKTPSKGSKKAIVKEGGNERAKQI